ncbi:MAG: transposase, partial [Rubrobacter sp.]|nr:transposase [Rubrobacter sp.]
RNWGKNVTLISSITLAGMGPSMLIEGPSDGESFGLYLNEVLGPRLSPGRIVVMDNLSCPQEPPGKGVLIEEDGCELWFLPAYSPDLNPIEQTFSKDKGGSGRRKLAASTHCSRLRERRYAWSPRRMLAVSSRTGGTSSRGSALYENCFKPRGFYVSET